MNGSVNSGRLSILRRGTAVWFVIILAEVLHGTVRRMIFEPLIGDLRARQVGVVVGSLIIFAIAFVCVRWLKGDRALDFLAVGILWAILTVAFEVALGRLVMQVSWARIFSDYDIAQGGLMFFGLLAMLLSPIAAARLTDEI